MESSHIAIWCMLIACVMPLVFTVIAKKSAKFTIKDNQNPRTFLANTTGLAARANAAQQNSFENLPFFLSAVLIAQYMVVNQVAINKLAIAYIVLRVFYGVAFISNQAMLRSVLFTLAFACPILLYWLAL